MTNHTTLTSLIASLEQTCDHLISSAADAMTDGEWDTATDLTEAARVVDRQRRFRLDELADLDD